MTFFRFCVKRVAFQFALFLHFSLHELKTFYYKLFNKDCIYGLEVTCDGREKIKVRIRL